MNTARSRVRPVGTFLVERYWPGVTFEQFSDAARRVLDSIDGLRREGMAIQSVASTLVPGDEAAYWIVDAPSTELVASVYARAGVPVERIVPAVDLRPVSRLKAVGPGPIDEPQDARISASESAGSESGQAGRNR